MATTDQTGTRMTFGVPRIKGAQFAAIVLVLLIAATLRLYAIDQNSLWGDELATLAQSNKATLGEVFEALRLSVHPPGHNIMLFFFRIAVGVSELALRLPSAWAGLLAVAVIFKIGQVLFSFREGLFAATFLAILATPIFYAQEARPYSLLLFATLSATLFWILIIRALQRGINPKVLITLGYVAAAIAASYMHYYGLYLIVWQGIGLYLFGLTRPRLMGFVLGIYIPIVVAFLPWYSALSYQAGRGPSWIESPGENALLNYFKFLFNDSSILTILFALLMLLLFVSLAKRYIRIRGDWRQRLFPLSPTLFLILWLLLPVITVYAVSLLWVPILTNRNLIICLPAAYLLLARAITTLPVRPKFQSAVALSLSALFMFNLLFSVNYYSEPQKPQMREAVQYIIDRDSQLNNAMIVAYRLGRYDYYFLQEQSSSSVDLVIVTPRDISRIVEAVEAQGYGYVWFISARYTGPNANFIESFNEDFQLVEQQSFRWADVWLFRVRNE